MAFYLVKESHSNISFHGDVEGSHFKRFVTLPVSIETTQTEDGALSNAECEQLKRFLQNEGDPPRQNGKSKDSEEQKIESKKTLLDSSLQVTIAMQFNSNGNNRDYVTMTEVGSANVLQRLKNFLEKHGLQLKLNFQIQKLLCEYTRAVGCTTIMDHVVSMDTDIDEITSPTGAQLVFSGFLNRTYWHDVHQCKFSGVISISCFMFPAASILDSVVFKREKLSQIRTINQEILNNATNHNAIITTNGSFFNCHKAFLSAHSEVLKSMVHAVKNQIVGTVTVKLNEMSEDGVRALLNFLYTDNTVAADEDCAIALELLKASIKYRIPLLEKRMKSVMQAKPDEWFEPDVCMQLFVFVKDDFPENDPLRIKAITLVQKKYDAVKKSPTYKKLRANDPVGIKQLVVLLSGSKISK